MECTEVITEPRRISRDIEARMYKFLQLRCEGDCLRYQLLAKKVHRSADGTANDGDWAIVQDWVAAMLEAEQPKELPALAAAMKPQTPFESIRAGKAGNLHYQAFLDTLEQHELDAIENNAPFFLWMSQRLAEKPADVRFGIEYLRGYADQHLSARVKALRATV